MYRLKEEREMTPKIFSNMVASLLYQKRFGPYFVEPLVAGLGPNDEPFISGMDLIGAPVFAKDFVLAGTSNESMFGMFILLSPFFHSSQIFQCFFISSVSARFSISRIFVLFSCFLVSYRFS